MHNRDLRIAPEVAIIEGKHLTETVGLHCSYMIGVETLATSRITPQWRSLQGEEPGASLSRRARTRQVP